MGDTVKQSTADRREALLDRFEAGWRRGEVPEIGDFVAGLGLEAPATARAELLRELAAVDLEYRWRRPEDLPGNDSLSGRPLLEDYLTLYPEGVGEPWLNVELIAAEFYVRSRWGDRPAIASYCNRFPSRSAELLPLLEEAQAQLDAENSTGGNRADESAIESGGGGNDECGTATTRFRGNGDALPERIGRFRVFKLLGRGGMGDVFLAEDEQIGRQVAVKVPRFVRAGEKSAIERFRREAQAAGNVQHPHICPIFEFGEEGGRFFIAMPYIEGARLNESIAAFQRRPQRDAATLVRTLAVAMQAAHQKGVIHRDLKPGNIMLTRQGEPIVTDFGLAALQSAPPGERLSTTGELLGTPAYMSPEQVEGETKRVGPATDVYGLGAILYELLTGRPPFAGSVGSVMAQIVHKPPPAPQSIRPDVDDGLNELCLRMLAKSPEDRPASMNDVVDELDRCLDRHEGKTAQTTETEIDTAAGADGSSGRNWKRILTAGGAFLVSLVVIVLATDRGTVEIDAADPAVKFRITRDGKEIDGPRLQVGEKSVTYWSGDYAIELTGVNGDRFEVEPASFQVRRGKTVLVRITEKLRALPAAAPDAGLVAKAAATRETIRKINEVIMPEWENGRIVKLPEGIGTAAGDLIPCQRSIATWATMRMELPDRYEDLFYQEALMESHGVTADVVQLLNSNPIQAKYRKACLQQGNFLTGLLKDFPAIERLESPECLYLIVKFGLGRDATADFAKDEWGDADNDGMPEFHDAWGTPIQWLRWPAGFRSALQTGREIEPVLVENAARIPLGFRTNFPFKIWPLIVSAGPDRKFGLRFVEGLRLSQFNRNPYHRHGIEKYLLGEVDETDTDEDNIHNHDLILETMQIEK